MLKTTKSSVTFTFRVDDNKIIGVSDDRVDIGNVGSSDTSKKSTKSKSQTKNGYLDNNNNLEKLKRSL